MLPVEWTEKREPGDVVPMPTLPLLSILMASVPLPKVKVSSEAAFNNVVAPLPI